MRNSAVALLLALAACAPPTSRNEASEETSPAADRYSNPAPDDKEAPKPLPAPEPEPDPLPPVTAGKSAEPPYTARGQEPGWALTIVDGRIDYQGNYGDKRIRVAAPPPSPIAEGRRYVTERLTVEIVRARCNDAMSGQGFEDKVKVVADGETYEGCGGKRRPDLDM